MNCYEVNIRLMQTLVSEDFVPGILLFWQISIFFSKRERERERCLLEQRHLILLTWIIYLQVLYCN